MKINKNITIIPVNQTNWNDFDTLFQSKGILRKCCCMAWRMTKDELKQNNPTSRKGFIKRRIETDVPAGLLAYADNESIACFYIKTEYRDHGLIDVLIEHAKTYARKNGAGHAEAYPVEPDSPSYRYMGFGHTVEKAGFSFVKKPAREDR